MATDTSKILRDIKAIRNTIDCDETNGLISLESWSHMNDALEALAEKIKQEALADKIKQDALGESGETGGEY